MTRYRKKPVVIDAIEWTGDNIEEVDDFLGAEGDLVDTMQTDGSLFILAELENSWVNCPIGYWVIRGVQGEHYPCAPDVFAVTYEPADEL